jgi:chromate transporter
MHDAPESPNRSAALYTLWQLVAYMLRLGTIGFGGPVALVGYMHRDLVEQRRWITEAEYKEGLTLAQLAPGPLAAQLAIYLGYVHHGVLGATLVGIALVIPSFIMVLAIGWAYVRYGGLPWMQSVFHGVGAAVIGIIAFSAYKLTRKTIGKDRLLWSIFIVSAAVTIITESEIVWLFFAAGLLVWLVRTRRNGFGDLRRKHFSVLRPFGHSRWRQPPRQARWRGTGRCSVRSPATSQSLARSSSAAALRSFHSSMAESSKTTAG